MFSTLNGFFDTELPILFRRCSELCIFHSIGVGTSSVILRSVSAQSGRCELATSRPRSWCAFVSTIGSDSLGIIAVQFSRDFFDFFFSSKMCVLKHWIQNSNSAMLANHYFGSYNLPKFTVYVFMHASVKCCVFLFYIFVLDCHLSFMLFYPKFSHTYSCFDPDTYLRCSTS